MIEVGVCTAPVIEAEDAEVPRDLCAEVYDDLVLALPSSCGEALKVSNKASMWPMRLSPWILSCAPPGELGPFHFFVDEGQKKLAYEFMVR